MDKCPNCGNDEYYKVGKVKGKVRIAFRFDGELQGEDGDIFSIPDNSSMYDGVNYSLGKTKWCNNCDKKLPSKIEKDKL